MRAEDSVLRDQVFALEEQSLVDQSRDIRQEACPFVVLHAESTWYRSRVERFRSIF